MVSTHLKNISQNGNLPQIGVNIKNIWNHQPAGHFNMIKELEQTAEQSLQEVFWTSTAVPSHLLLQYILGILMSSHELHEVLTIGISI